MTVNPSHPICRMHRNIWSSGFRKNASSEINLAKAILFKYVSTDMEVEERELNELAHEVFNRQRQTST